MEGPGECRMASPAAVGSRPTPEVAVKADDPVRAMQHALYRVAKADPGRRFHTLNDKVSRRDVLWRGGGAARRQNGAPGIARTTPAQGEEYGVGGCSTNWPTNCGRGRIGRCRPDGSGFPCPDGRTSRG